MAKMEVGQTLPFRGPKVREEAERSMREENYNNNNYSACVFSRRSKDTFISSYVCVFAQMEV